jgi:molybdopterin molybdotransferase
VRVEWGEARRRAWAAAVPVAAVEVPLAAAAGGTLAAPLRASTAVPGFDCSAMDGYAVGSATGPWTLVGQVLAGPERARAPLTPGTAVEIATGAAIPAGTVAVVPYEQADRVGDRLAGPAHPGRHVRRTGEDVPLGADLLPAGTPVTPTVLGLAAEVGLDLLAVRRPAVAVLLTGDELVHAGGSGAGMVRDSVGPALPGWIAGLGGRPLPGVPVPDTDAGTVARAIAAADAAVVLTSGGAGGGPKDLIAAALRELGAELVVDGLDCRPGAPARLAALPDGRWVVVLPGYPYAALVAVLTLLGPLLAGLSGRPLPTLRTAPLAGPPAPSRNPRTSTRVLPVRWRGDGVVEAIGRDRPGNLWGAAEADHLAVVPPDPAPGGSVRLLDVP